MHKKNNLIILTTPSPVSHRTAEENLGIGYLASVLRKNEYDVVIIDGWLLGLSSEELAKRILSLDTPLFVGFSAYQSNMEKAIETINIIKKEKNIPFIAGGFGPTFNPEDFLISGFDIVARGEGEETLLEIAKYYKGEVSSLSDIYNISFKDAEGVIIKTPFKSLSYTLDEIPYPARDTVMHAVNKRTPVHLLTARGCSGVCSFCSINAFFKMSKTKKYRQRSLNNIIGELEKLYSLGIDNIKVIDDSFIDGNRNEEWTREFANKIKQRGMKFNFRGSVRADKVTDEMLHNLKEAGFFSFSCGIENFSSTALKRMNKAASLEQNLKALDLFKKYDIYVQAGQILFDDSTTIEELNENFYYMNKYDWIISKGIFTEMFAAEGTDFTKKIDEKKLKSSDSHKMGNYKYKILNDDVLSVYSGLKKWHIAHMYIYDKAIDPLTSPKALNQQELKMFYEIYKKIRKKDLFIFKNILKLANAKQNSKIQEYVDIEIKNNNSFFKEISSEVDVVYQKTNLKYDACINPFIEKERE